MRPSFKASASGTCSFCKEEFQKGDLIAGARGDYMHAECGAERQQRAQITEGHTFGSLAPSTWRRKSRSCGTR